MEEELTRFVRSLQAHGYALHTLGGAHPCPNRLCAFLRHDVRLEDLSAALQLAELHQKLRVPATFHIAWDIMDDDDHGRDVVHSFREFDSTYVDVGLQCDPISRWLTRATFSGDGDNLIQFLSSLEFPSYLAQMLKAWREMRDDAPALRAVREGSWQCLVELDHSFREAVGNCSTISGRGSTLSNAFFKARQICPAFDNVAAWFSAIDFLIAADLPKLGYAFEATRFAPDDAPGSTVWFGGAEISALRNGLKERIHGRGGFVAIFPARYWIGSRYSELLSPPTTPAVKRPRLAETRNPDVPTVPQPPPVAPIFAKPDWNALVWPEYIVNVRGAPISLAAAAQPRYSSARLTEITIIRVFDDVTIYSDRSTYSVPSVSDERIAANECSYPIILDIGQQECGSYEVRATVELTSGSCVTRQVFLFVQEGGDEIPIAATSQDSPGRAHSDHPCERNDIMLLYPSFTRQAYNHFSGYSFYRPSLETLPGKRRIFVNRPLLPNEPTYHSPKVIFPFEKLLRTKKLSFNIMDNEYFQIYGLDAINSYRHLVVVGHDEYISAKQRDALREYLFAGGRISIFGGNFCWWKVEYESSRHLSVLKVRDVKGKGDDRWVFVDSGPHARDFGLSFGEGGYPIQKLYKKDKLSEIGWTVEEYSKSAGMEVVNPDHPIFEGTKLSEGEVFGDADMLMQVEVDGAIERKNEVFVNREILARGWLCRPGRIIGKVGTIAEVTFPGGGRLLHLGSIGWYRAIAGDPVCRRIAENVIRYQALR